MNPSTARFQPHEIDALTIEQMLTLLDIQPSRRTYLYLDRDQRLSAAEKPWPDTYPADEWYAIGYVWKLRG